MVTNQQITAQAAHQIVNDWLFDEVSYMLTAGEPQLVVDGTTWLSVRASSIRSSIADSVRWVVRWATEVDACCIMLNFAF